KIGPLVVCVEPGLNPDGAEATLRMTLQLLEAEARARGARVLFARVDARDPELLRAVEREGFTLVDSVVTFHIVMDDAGQLRQDKKPGEYSYPTIAGRDQSFFDVSVHTSELASSGSLEVTIRSFEPSDLARLQHIAKFAFRHDHFHSDPRIPPKVADEVYVTWVKNSCQGRADAVLVAEEPGNLDGVSGFITCRLDRAVLNVAGIPHGIIELVAVSPEAQGRGIGVALVLGSLEWFARHGFRSVEVGTQSRNTQAMRLYHRCGFKCVAFSHTFHKWIAGP
ncbi:MAG TPA: GNAT family N-acetyltransferase, partial [Clostridia bacterium]|nr:GNAT family N-acetyltransferase [Clostridia bacterium]